MADPLGKRLRRLPPRTYQGRAFIELLGAAAIVAIVAERIRLPAAVALVGFGAIISSTTPIDLPFAFGPELLFIFLPPLISEAA